MMMSAAPSEIPLLRMPILTSGNMMVNNLMVNNLKGSRLINYLDFGGDDDLKWKSNVEYLVKKAAKRLFLLKVLKSYNAPVQDLKLFYTSVIRSILEYCAQVWHGS